MPKNLGHFYNHYHKKNKRFINIIGRNNVTYFNHIRLSEQAISRLKKKRIRILDVGCGVGSLAFYFANQGYEVDAYDISSDAIQMCKDFKSLSGMKNIHFFKGNIEKISARKKYDLVLCSEVIEHLENDARFLNKLGKLCFRKGILLLSTPSINAPLFRLGFLDEFDRRVGHLRRYNPESIRQLITVSGFRVEELFKVEGIIRNSLYTIEPLGIFLKFVRGPTVKIFHMIDQVAVKTFGESNYIIVARKK